MRSASRKPLVMSNSVRSPLRSSSALVATVVPIFTAPMRSLGIAAPGASPSRRRMPSTAASRYASGLSERSLWVVSAPSGRRPMTSVNVPPRSTQNSQAPLAGVGTVPDMRSIPPVVCVTLGVNNPAETCRVGTAFAQASAWAKSNRRGANAASHSDDFAHPTNEEALMHKIAIAKAQTERLQTRLGKLHPFDVLDPAKTALVVIDMQNYFVKQGHQSEVPLAREIVPNINRLAAELRRRGGHVVWVRNGTNDTRESWSNYHNYLQSRDRAERRLQQMEVGADGYAYWHLNDIRPEDAQITKKRYSAFIQGSSDIERHLRDRGIDTILVTGTATNVCCESTARDAMMLNFKVVMVADGLATHTDAEHNATLSNFYGQFGDVQTVDEAIESLARGAKKAAA